MKAIELLDILAKVCDNVPNDFCEEDNHRWIDSATRTRIEELAGQKIEYDSGVSKFVIIPKNENYVLKIPYRGHYEDAWIENENYSKNRGDEDYDYEKAGHYEYTFYDFDNAYFNNAYNEDGGKHAWNYCNAEVDFYEEAVDSGFELYFAAEELLGFIGEHPVYKQERAIAFRSSRQSVEDFYSDHHDEYEKTDNFLMENECDGCFPVKWVYDFIRLYGEEEFLRFHNFCDSLSILQDMHCGNFGYVEGDIPILIDYSNFEG